MPQMPSSANNTTVPSAIPDIGTAPRKARPVLEGLLAPPPPDAVALGPPDELPADPPVELAPTPADPDGELCVEQFVNGQSALDCTIWGYADGVVYSM